MFYKQKIASCKNTVRKPVYVLMVESLNIYRWLFLADVQSQQQMISWVDDILKTIVLQHAITSKITPHISFSMKVQTRVSSRKFVHFFERRRGNMIKHASQIFIPVKDFFSFS